MGCSQPQRSASPACYGRGCEVCEGRGFLWDKHYPYPTAQSKTNRELAAELDDDYWCDENGPGCEQTWNWKWPCTGNLHSCDDCGLTHFCKKCMKAHEESCESDRTEWCPYCGDHFSFGDDSHGRLYTYHLQVCKEHRGYYPSWFEKPTQGNPPAWKEESPEQPGRR